MQKRRQQVRSPINLSDPEYIAVQEEQKRFDALHLRLQEIRALEYGTEIGNQLRQLATEMQMPPELADFEASQQFADAVGDHAHYVSTGNHRDRARWASTELE
ncbi:hypothetical protein [Burkholderia sp. S171]|uniref:hypothetical protein n=1 Tax=Burkholderia sp. S171 TaxID=1641860 RepID=UPI00131C4B8A|nr:hypothetical protein [Burkholderia sp. S171]